MNEKTAPFCPRCGGIASGRFHVCDRRLVTRPVTRPGYTGKEDQ